MANMTSAQGYDLSQSPTFVHRLSVLLCTEGMVVLNESTGVPFHVTRAVLAKNIIFSPDAYSATLARELVFDANLIGAGFTVDSAGKPVDSLATDAAIRSQIATNWTAWSS